MNFEGYVDERFKSTVPEDLHCPICRNVLKDPKQCKENEHHFCEQCIISHLTVSRTCPMCQEYLTVKSLKKPSRFIRNNLDNLEISCENEGCKAVVCLGELQSHIASCDYALVRCSNGGCRLEVKRKDKEYHEKVHCRYRVIRCKDCQRLTNQVFQYRLAVVSMLLILLGYWFECVINV